MSEFLVGISPHHAPALIAALLLPLGAWYARVVLRRHAHAGAGWAQALRERWARSPVVVRWAVWLLGFTAVVHLALPLGHNDQPVLTVLFLGSGATYAVMAWRAVNGQRWRAATALLMVGTVVAYLVVVGTGDEEADQVGLATALDELVVLGLCLVPPLGAGGRARRWLVRPMAATSFVLAIVLSGLVSWAQFAIKHDDHGVAGGAGEAGVAGRPGDGHADHHHHDYLARAQAGVVLRPAPPSPTEQQLTAAADLAARTKASLVKYRDYHAAIADGFLFGGGPAEGLEVHFTKKAFSKDNRVFDPAAPESLVYAIQKGRAVLLGAMYQMPRAGQAGPAIGGSLTHWHTHNACLTLLPPGFGVVSPYGTCPFGTFQVTPAEMIHVWTVDPPGGPYTEHLDRAWVRDLTARVGLPV